MLQFNWKYGNKLGWKLIKFIELRDWENKKETIRNRKLEIKMYKNKNRDRKNRKLPWKLKRPILNSFKRLNWDWIN